MRYGIELPNGGVCRDVQALAELAHEAEEAGWDGVFLEDYIIWQGNQDTPTWDPWITLAAMALRTKRIRLGTEVTALARRRPWKLARETVTLDHLSNGRVILSVGLGVSSDIDLTHFGEVIDTRQRAKMLDEALKVLVGLWSGQPFSFQGQYYQVREVKLWPPPVQTPRIPIWVGGGFPLKGPTRRATRWDGSCLYRHSDDGKWLDWTPASVRQLKATIESERTPSTPFDIVVGHSSWRRVADWEQERAYIRSLAEAGATWWVEYVSFDTLEEMRAIIKYGPLRID